MLKTNTSDELSCYRLVAQCMAHCGLYSPSIEAVMDKNTRGTFIVIGSPTGTGNSGIALQEIVAALRLAETLLEVPLHATARSGAITRAVTERVAHLRYVATSTTAQHSASNMAQHATRRNTAQRRNKQQGATWRNMAQHATRRSKPQWHNMQPATPRKTTQRRNMQHGATCNTAQHGATQRNTA
jgi:hypothetical protein